MVTLANAIAILDALEQNLPNLDEDEIRAEIDAALAIMRQLNGGQ